MCREVGMELSQENLYVVGCFEKNFIKGRSEKVVIYGIGVNTRAILASVDTSNIVGLMDASCEGSSIMGQPVLTMEEARQRGSCVVIVARNSMVPIIFERIKALETEWDFPVFNIHGERLIRKKALMFENNTPYWEKTGQSLLQAISQSDVISFDIFDTLVVRDCMLPEDIFRITEQALEGRQIPADHFYDARREAEFQIRESFPTIDAIYRLVQEKMGWTAGERETAKRYELALELEHCFPGEHMRQVYQKALAMGKRVILASDMYLPFGEMRKILQKCGISGYLRLYISCEEKADKKSGKLFRKILEDGYRNILHIGDNAVSDGDSARAQGIRSFTVWSPYEMLVQSSLRGLLSHTDSLEKRNCVGKIQRKLFGNPFCLGTNRGMVRILDHYTLGYVFLAPVIRCFLSFLADTLREEQADKVLFCARDGYVLWKLYQKMAARDPTLPKGVYFKTSRRAITVASIQDEADIALILQKPYKATMGELLETRFGVQPDSADPAAMSVAVSTGNPGETEAYILGYKDQIFENARREREAYCRYMEKNSILEGSRIAVYDFCSGGTIQHCLGRFTDAEIKGIYFATVNLPNVFYQDDRSIKPLFGNIGQYDMQSHLARHYMYMEAVLTDEHGTLVKFGQDGSPVYDEEENSRRDYRAIEEIQRGILEYCEETLDKEWYGNYRELSAFADHILGMLFQPEICAVAEEVKHAVQAESRYDFLDSYPAWSEE